MPKRLLFICQYFYPETFRGNDIAFYMVRRGVDVTVICGTPNYPKGKFFDGYGWFKKSSEIINGVKVIRVPIIPRGNGSAVKLLANYFSYFTVASFFLPYHLLTNKEYDSCFVQQLSPVMMSVPGVLFKKLTGKKLYTWVLDLWPESLKAAGGIKNQKILNFFSWFAKLQYRNSDKILVSSKGFEEKICEKGEFASKIQHMPNWAEDELQGNTNLPIPEFPKGFNVLFAGNVGEAQDFENVVEAAKLLTDDDNINFIIIGDGRKKEWVEGQIKEYHLENRFIMIGRFDIKYMPSFFKKADCLFLSLKDDEILNSTVPAKLQAYMASGKPIVAMISGDANQLVKNVECGFSVPASSPSDFAHSLRNMRDLDNEARRRMGEKAKEYCRLHYNKDKILDSLYDLIFV